MTRHDLATVDEPVDSHALDCAVWLSDDPLDDCDCGAQDAARNQAPTTAQRLDRLHPNPVPLACDGDEAAAS